MSNVSSTLLISEVFPPRTGGSGRWFWEIYRRMSEENVAVAAGETPGQAKFDQSDHLSVHRVPLTLPAWGVRSIAGLRGYSRAIRKLIPIIRNYGVTHIHAGRVLPEGIMAWWFKRFFGIPYLSYVHGEEITCTSASRELRWLARRVVSGASLLIANSHNTAQIAQQLWRAEPNKIHVLHPGVDTSRFHPAVRDINARNQLGWADRPVILTVGRLQKRKGHDHLIRALNVIRPRVPTVLYSILGDGEQRAELEQLVCNEGHDHHVQFLGERNDDELVTAYQQCDLFTLPNREIDRDIEGFGMVLVEAQACGKPVIAGTSGGTSETMIVNKTGCVVDCTTPEHLGIVLSQWLSDQNSLRIRGLAARHWAVERFSWESLGAQARDLFRSAFANNSRDPQRVSNRPFLTKT